MDYEFDSLLNPGVDYSTVAPFMNLWLPHPAPAYNENSESLDDLLY